MESLPSVGPGVKVYVNPLDKGGHSLVHRVPTGLFLNSKKSSLLIRTVKTMLQERFNTVAVVGPEQNDKCEIYLQALNESPAYFNGSKDLLEKYLGLVEEHQPGTVICKQPEIIDLATDDDRDHGSGGNETSFIVLDHDNDDGESVVITLDQTVDTIIDLDDCTLAETDKRKSVCSIEDANIKGTVSIEEIIVLDTVEEKNSLQTLDLPQRASIEDANIKGTVSIEEIIVLDPVEEKNRLQTLDLPQRAPTKNTSQESNRVARKRYLSEVEILDDEVVVMNEFHSPKRINTNINCVSNSPEKVSNLEVTLIGNNRTVHCEPASEAVQETVDQLEIAALPAPIEIEDDEDTAPSGHSNSLAYVPPKKVSKLTYKRTAHLVEHLTKGTTGNSSDTNTDSNIFNPNANSAEKRTGLRPIVIDGNNVAISCGEFSLKRLQMCINYFEKRGHRQIKAFLPHYRINRETYDSLNLMERQGTVVFTPSRKVNGKRVTSYDDRFIVQYATQCGGVIVTTDNYRDLLEENPNWKETIDQRILMFSWVDDVLMFPQDPMGRHGPTLDEFLEFPG